MSLAYHERTHIMHTSRTSSSVPVATLQVNGGATFAAGDTQIGVHGATPGLVEVSGANSQFTSTNALVGIGSAGSLSMSSGGTVSIGNSLTLGYGAGHTGSAHVLANGTLQVPATATGLAKGAGNAFLEIGGGTLRLTGAGAPGTFTTEVPMTLTANSTLDTQAHSATISLPRTGTGALTKVGTGALTLAGAQALGGNLIIDGGTLAQGAATAVLSLGGPCR